MKARHPNFLIVGAAKSGTTSIFHYLKEHPEIFMPSVKEPRFFLSQFIRTPLQGIKDEDFEKSMIHSFDQYLDLFRDIGSEKASGEASVDNLYYYDHSIKLIKEYLGDVRIVIVLRNPADRAFSSYAHQVRRGEEPLGFEEALASEEERIKKNWRWIWHYQSVGLYAEQVRAYLDAFSRVHVRLYDDLLKSPLDFIRDLYEFLNVDSTFVPSIKVRYNISGNPRSRLLHRFLSEQSSFRRVLRAVLRPIVPRGRRRMIMEGIKSKNLKKMRMRPETRNRLQLFYGEDILKLQRVIGRDLSNWLEE